MKVIEFYLSVPQAFETLCSTFYTIGGKFKRKVDGASASAVYAVSYNSQTGWVQLLIDDNAPQGTLNAVMAAASGLASAQPEQYQGDKDYLAPMERKRR